MTTASRRTSALPYACGAALTLLLTIAPAGPVHAANRLSSREVVELVNEQRLREGCPKLTADAELTRMARAHSRDMAERVYFSHTTPDGTSPIERADEAGAENFVGENIARGQDSAWEVVHDWLDSDDHRNHILDCSARTTGVGVADGPEGPYWVQEFGW
ncbi:CAP domain-containing protein [Allostreptomyces psammosilenae]|uniref:Uncharacterized protein YkwD n=1 Tax=Allostreptomyces psammosilenae TaxID=1892865 RepID=A0A852ZXU8_9ACTN|nr:CAP domain-containing protein [Allostreptomyces psammosilenae]NYI06597.1 uncharacterized protein YkwD [Allostreptomyces psammosilenae]